MKKVLYLVMLFLLSSGKMLPSHMVGGEIFYDPINDSTYRITLKLYRDCINGLAPFAGVQSGTIFVPAMISVYGANNNAFIDTFNIGAPVITNIPSSINNPCITPPGGVCVEQGVYTYTLTLPQRPGGYYVVYQATYRNATINNLATPNTQGSTYYIKIPGPEVPGGNSSPRFSNFPPIFICNKVLFKFDHKATDPDGDQLVYSLCSPYDGQSGLVAPPPPYAPVNYLIPFSGSYPIPSASPAFSIDPVTGMLAGRPTNVGQYVVSVCVEEYRGNNLINTHYRDFQFNVVPCIVQAVSLFADQKSMCEGSSLTFTNQSFGNAGNLSYLWDFGVPAVNTDTSVATNPTFSYQDTGTYVVTLIANPNQPCSDTIQKTVYVYPPLIAGFPPSQKQCFKGNAFTFSATGVYLPYATFNWNFSPAASPNVSTLKNPPVINYNQWGKFPVMLIAKQLTCIDTFIDTVKVFAPPVAKIGNRPGSFCDPATVGFVNASSSELPVTYTWLFSNGVTASSFEPVQVFSPAGVYTATLIASTSSVCVDTSMAISKTFTVRQAPQAGFTFSPQVTTIFDPDIMFTDASSADATAWYYEFGDESNSTSASNLHTYQTYGDFTVKLTIANEFNCTDAVTQIVKILPEFRFWIPNTFTPGGDGLNDVFMPSVTGVEDYKFHIYTRWGDLAYSTNDPKEGWNGTHQGKESPDGLYTWKITFKNVVSALEEMHFGYVFLLRKSD